MVDDVLNPSSTLGSQDSSPRVPETPYVANQSQPSENDIPTPARAPASNGKSIGDDVPQAAKDASPPAVASDKYDEASLQAAGFSADEIAHDKADTAHKLQDAGFKGPEIAQYFGLKPDQDLGPLKSFVNENLQQFKTTFPDGMKPVGPPSDANSADSQTFTNAFLAGLQMSVSGLQARHKMPDHVLPEDAPMAMQIMKQAGMFLGDAPAMLEGGIIGGAAGSEVPIVGNAVGAAAGAFAAPAALRQYYVDSIQKGTVASFSDFWSRTAAVAWAGAKGAITGAATEGVGGLVSKSLGEAVLPSVVQSGGKITAELATMTTVGKGLEGQMPTVKDFAEGAILLAGVKGLVHAAGGFTTGSGDLKDSTEIPSQVKDLHDKLGNIYSATGLKPSEIVLMSAKDPVLKQELLSEGTDVPKSLEGLTQKPPGDGAPPPPGGAQPKMQSPNVSAEMNGLHPALTEGFAPDANWKVELKKASDDLIPLSKETVAQNEGEGPQTPRDRILSRIGENGDSNPSKGWNNWYTKTVDRFNPIKQWMNAVSSDSDTPTKENPFIAMSTAMSKGFARAHEAITRGPTDMNGDKILNDVGEPVPSFKEIITRFKDDPNGFKAFGMAKRALELGKSTIEHPEGRNVGIDLEDAAQFVKEGEEKYGKSWKDLQDWQNASGIDQLKESGFYDKETAEKIKSENKDYFPMRVTQTGETTGGVSSSNPIKKLFGSEKYKTDPFQQLIANAYEHYRLSEENLAKQKVVEFGIKNDAPTDLIQREPTPVKKIVVSEHDVMTAMEKAGNDVSQVNPFTVETYRANPQPLSDGQFSVMRNGEREVYNVDPSLGQALKAQAYTEPNLLMKIAKPFATLQRIGVVENPAFLTIHGIRDAFTSTIQSNNGAIFGLSSLRGLMHSLLKTSAWDEFERNGGASTTMADMVTKYKDDDIWGLSNKTGLLDKTQNVVSTPLHLMNTLAQAVFNAPKMGEFLAALKNGKDPATAAWEGRNATVDVQKTGSSPLVQGWSSITPFFGMRIRGLDRFAQALQENPVGTSVKTGLAITLPSILTWSFFHNDPRYKNAPDWERDHYWIIPLDKWEKATPQQYNMMDRSPYMRRVDEQGQTWVNNGSTMRVPKPFEQGLVAGSFVERTLDKFFDEKPEAYKGFMRAMYGDLVPNLTPPVITPALEQWANKSFLTGGNIVPDQMTKVAEEFQYKPGTSKSAIQLGKAIGYMGGNNIGEKRITLASPMVVENYVRQWAGSMGQLALQVGDEIARAVKPEAFPTEPAKTLADIPGVRSFIVRYPSMGAQPVQDFYDNIDKIEESMATFNQLKKSGDIRSAVDYRSRPEVQQWALSLSGIKSTIGKQIGLVQLIEKDRDDPGQHHVGMSPNEKTENIQGIYYQIIQEANQANKEMHDFQKAVNSKH